MNTQFKEFFQSKTVKMALSATIAIFIANKIGLQFGVTSGVIAILSILNTKKEAIKVGVKRIFSCTIAILLSGALYIALGNSTIIFGLFLLIFIPITKKLNLEEGITIGAVLSTHLLISNNINFQWVINEFILSIIGIGVALIFNLYTPSLEEEFLRNKEIIEDKYKSILSEMALRLLMDFELQTEQVDIEKVEKLILDTREIAYKINNNYLFKNDCYYINYMDMRIMQLDTIRRMKNHFERLNMKYEQAVILSEFTLNVSVNVHEKNDCIKLIEELQILREEYKKMELPKTREEFENRATLFQFLNDLEDLLTIKKEFKKNNCK
ncbi:MAG: aromatic acid exporter family protein [Clostridium cadaveris]|uniref:aromatic acid exporter family protein n=1 Tax=Clostridium cadaveris TaxID=1529 RepID=UPI001459322D|nr:aromatic acid exporter family protein [Clostridium cadaveris]MDY4947750.1 aromatic acid exporter family protein [Clostridium cadaveris]NME64291.1 aromatic acid exporter family protein [Clostridium cadaveris]UFH65970.1 aromatic acid exporter family protein [Clostridium cadaveris]